MSPAALSAGKTLGDDARYYQVARCPRDEDLGFRPTKALTPSPPAIEIRADCSRNGST